MKLVVNNELTQNKPLIYEESFWIGKKSLTYDGVVLTKTKNNIYEYKTEDETHEFVVKGSYYFGVSITMFGKEVHAYIDVFKSCAYVSLAKFEESDVFWAYVTGYEEGGRLGSDRIELMHLEPIGEKRQYDISKTVKINEDITLDDIIASACDINGSGLYMFTCNKKGEINTISKPTPYWGFEDKAYSLTYSYFV